ncbi:MAG: hypothetical protein ACREN6_16790 [Gemmatimonadaceae bacterium]
MTRRGTITFAAAAIFSLAGTARAQRASLAIGAATAVGDLANTAGTGFDVQLQVRTEPMIGPIPLRIDIGYDWLAGKGTARSTVISAQSVSLLGDFGSRFYWIAGPGFYQSTQTINVSGHNAAEQRDYLGAQVAVGMDIPVFRWTGFLEVAGVRFFSPHPTPMYVPVRFGIRL